MATRTAPRPIAYMSEEEFLARIHEKPSLEYIDGAVYRKPVTGKRHTRLAALLVHALLDYERQHGGWGGPEPHANFSDEFRRIYRVPDVAYWAPDKPDSDTDIALPPTLAVEVRSPGQSMAELREKCAFMRDHGVDVCWLVDPDTRTVEAHDADEPRVLRSGDVLESPALPGFSLAIDDLFSVLD